MSKPAAPRRGLYVDLIIPCAADGRVLAREYHVHLRRMARVRDIQGVIVNGPAGEAAVLERAQRMKILDIALSAAPSGFPVFAAIPAAAAEFEDELKAIAEAGAAGVVILSGGSDSDDQAALARAVSAAGALAIISWGVALRVLTGAPGVVAAVLERAGPAALDGSDSLDIPIFLTDQSFDLEAIASGQAAGAILAAANIAESHWGKLFRHAGESYEDAQSLYAARLGHLHEALLAIAKAADHSRETAAAIKHALVLMTQNTSAATMPPLLKLKDHHQKLIAQALHEGKLMPGMG